VCVDTWFLLKRNYSLIWDLRKINLEFVKIKLSFPDNGNLINKYIFFFFSFVCFYFLNLSNIYI